MLSGLTISSYLSCFHFSLFSFSVFGLVWYTILNTCFQFLNNITSISIHFFTHMYFQKNWKLLFKHTYQTDHNCLPSLSFLFILGFFSFYGYYFVFHWQLTLSDNFWNSNFHYTTLVLESHACHLLTKRFCVLLLLSSDS